MLSTKMQEAINRQINDEFFSAYLYLALSAECDRQGLPGFSHWFKLQYHEELSHADRLFNYVLDRDGEVELFPIEKPELSKETTISIFERTLKHEQEITQGIFKLKDIARAESDHATDVFLEWFVTEQMEEEASVRQILDQLKLIDGNPNGLFLIDRELSGRKEESSDG